MSFPKSIGNVNNIPDFTAENITIENANITNLNVSSGVTIPNVVTASSNITDHAIVRGDGGAKGVQTSGITIDDSNNMTGVNSITTGNITMNTGATLETNSIVSKTGSDITIDAVGDQRINFGTLSNFGTRFTTTTTTNWAAEFRNNTGNYMVVAGTYEQFGEHRPQIGGHLISPLAWDVLWLNPVTVSTALVCVGNQTRANVLSEGARLYIDGRTTSSDTIASSNNLVLKKASTTSATITGTFTGNRTITIQDKDQTLMDVNDHAVGLYTSDLTGLSIDGTTLTPLVFVATNITSARVYINTPTGTTIRVRVIDNVSSTVVLSGFLGGTSSNEIWNIDTPSGLAGTVRPFYVEFARTAGAGTSQLFSTTVYGS